MNDPDITMEEYIKLEAKKAPIVYKDALTSEPELSSEPMVKANRKGRKVEFSMEIKANRKRHKVEFIGSQTLCRGAKTEVVSDLLDEFQEGQPMEQPMTEATWEWLTDFQSAYPTYNLEEKLVFEGKNVTPTGERR
nr:hypothetical protein [Tanacetum cinerariifolium]